MSVQVSNLADILEKPSKQGRVSTPESQLEGEVLEAYECALRCASSPVQPIYALTKVDTFGEITNAEIVAEEILQKSFNPTRAQHKELWEKLINNKTEIAYEDLVTVRGDARALKNGDDFECASDFQLWKRFEDRETNELLHNLKQDQFACRLSLQIDQVSDVSANNRSLLMEDSLYYCRIHYTSKYHNNLTERKKEIAIRSENTRLEKKTNKPKIGIFTADIYSPQEEVTISINYVKQGLDLAKTYVAKCIIPVGVLIDAANNNSQWEHNITKNLDLKLTKDGKFNDSNPAIATVAVTVQLSYIKRKIMPPADLLYAAPKPATKDYIKLYQIIVEKLINSHPASQKEFLIGEERFILDDFAARYGLSKITQQLAELRAIVAKNDAHYLVAQSAFVKDTVVSITERSKTSSTETVSSATKSEKVAFAKVKEDLILQIGEVLKKFKAYVAPTDNAEVFSNIITLLKFIKDEDKDSNYDQYKQSIRTCIAEEYTKYLSENFDELDLHENYENFAKIAKVLQQKITEDSTFYSKLMQPIFESDNTTPYIKVAIEANYNAFSADIDKLVENLNNRMDEQKPKEVLDFCMQLKSFNSFIKELLDGIPHNIEFVKAADIAEPFIEKWLADTQAQLIKWSMEAIAIEKWEPISPPEILHSSSVVDIFSIFSQARDFLNQVESITERDNSSSRKKPKLPHLPQFAKVLCEVITAYSQRIYQMCLEDNVNFSAQHEAGDASTEAQQKMIMLGLTKRKGNDDKEEVIQLSLPEAFFVRINNIESCRNELNLLNKEEEAEEDPESEASKQKELLDSICSPTFAKLNNVLNELLTMVAIKIKTATADGLAALVEIIPPDQRHFGAFVDREKTLDEYRDVVGESMNEMKDFLNKQLEVFSSILYDELFRTRLLQRIYGSLLESIEELLCLANVQNENSKKKRPILSIKQSYILDLAMQELDKFFAAGGEGLSERRMKDESKLTRTVLDFYDNTTDELIKSFFAVEEDKSSVVKGYHIIQILAGREGDAKAEAFVKDKKAIVEAAIIRNHFGLPDDEGVVVGASHQCVNSKMITGNLYITEKHICFDTSISASSSMRYSGWRIVEELKDIQKLKLTQTGAGIGAFASKGLDIIMKDGKTTHVFCSMKKRNSAYKSIIAACAKLGVEIEDELRDEKNKKEKKLIQDFNLPEEEELLHNFSCINNGNTGSIFIFTSHVCFEDNNPKTPHIVIPINKIATLQKDSFSLLKNLALTIIDMQGNSYNFSNIMFRNDAFTAIVNRAQALGLSWVGDDNKRVSLDVAKSRTAVQQEALTVPLGDLQKEFQKKFNIAEEEQFIERFRCSRGKGGFLYVFDAHLCFEVHGIDSASAAADEQVIVSFDSIVSQKKTEKDALEIECKDNTKLVFREFINRDNALKTIVDAISATVKRPKSASFSALATAAAAAGEKAPYTKEEAKKWRELVAGDESDVLKSVHSVTQSIHPGKLYVGTKTVIFDAAIHLPGKKNNVIKIAVKDIASIREARKFALLGSGITATVFQTTRKESFEFTSVKEQAELFANVLASGREAGILIDH